MFSHKTTLTINLVLIWKKLDFFRKFEFCAQINEREKNILLSRERFVKAWLRCSSLYVKGCKGNRNSNFDIRPKVGLSAPCTSMNSLEQLSLVEFSGVYCISKAKGLGLALFSNEAKKLPKSDFQSQFSM